MKLTWNAALEESEMVMYETVHKLFKQTGFSADDVRCPEVLCALLVQPFMQGNGLLLICVGVKSIQEAMISRVPVKVILGTGAQAGSQCGSVSKAVSA